MKMVLLILSRTVNKCRLTGAICVAASLINRSDRPSGPPDLVAFISLNNLYSFRPKVSGYTFGEFVPMKAG